MTRTLFSAAVAATLSIALATIALSAVAQQATPTRKVCPDGLYAGKQSGRLPHFKEDYIWAVTREFAERFCMPAEYIVEDLKGAEAIAYRHRPYPLQWCYMKDGQEVNCNHSHSHWVEIYVKPSANIPKYNPEVKYFDDRETPSSRSMIEMGDPKVARTKQQLRYEARQRGEILEPPGLRNPYRGFTPGAEDKATTFHYLARLSPSQVQERPAAYEVRYYEKDVFDGLDLIMLEGWGGGNFAGPGYSEAPLGYAIGVTTSAPSGSKLRYPEGFHHVIEMPQRVMQVMNGIDRQAGQRFDDAIRGMVNSMLPQAPAGPPPTNHQKP